MPPFSCLYFYLCFSSPVSLVVSSGSSRVPFESYKICHHATQCLAHVRPAAYLCLCIPASHAGGARTLSTPNFLSSPSFTQTINLLKPLKRDCDCTGTNNTGKPGATYVCRDPRLGPKKLPRKFPLLGLVKSYDRFGGLRPGEYIAKWTDATGRYIYPPMDGFMLDILGAPIMGNMTLPVGTQVDRFGSEYGMGPPDTDHIILLVLADTYPSLARLIRLVTFCFCISSWIHVFGVNYDNEYGLQCLRPRLPMISARCRHRT